MDCNKEAIELMHKHLDGDISREEESQLKNHLEGCVGCQKHLHELKRTITLIQSSEKLNAPNDFTGKVMQQIPVEKKHVKYVHWFKKHPILTAAAIFFVFMFSGLLSAFESDSQLMVSNSDDLVIEDNTVIVPEGVTVEGDLVVQNGDLVIDGTVDGNVTLINGKLLENEGLDSNGLRADVGGVNGELKEVDRIFEWVWYNIQNLFKGIFSME